VICREFGVSYHPAHVSCLLGKLRLSLQKKPERRADPERRGGHRTLQRAPVAFPEKRALKEGRTIVFSAISRASIFCPWWFAPTPRWERRPSSMSISAAIIS
jgi:hypothetical protein